MNELIKKLAKLARRKHYVSAHDNWASCPKSPEGCDDPCFADGRCNCGADEHNKKVDKILKKMDEWHSESEP